MEQLIHAFGIDARLILIQVVNFGLLMAALTYFLYKPVLKLLDERAARIAKGIEDAKAAELALEAADEERKKIIAAANKEAEAMEQRAIEHAQKKTDEIIAEGHKKAEKIINEATVLGNELKIRSLREAETEIARITMLAVEKVLTERTK
jgi:F-type H+-transporting ATPase subunit b